MTAPNALADIKRKIADTLLNMTGVSGVGLRGNHVVVYLESDDPETRQKVEGAARKIAPTTAVAFEVTGRFQKQ